MGRGVRTRIKSPKRGLAIRRRLRDMGKTQADLARYLGASAGRISAICNGDDLLLSESIGLCRFLDWTHAMLIRSSSDIITDEVSMPSSEFTRQYLSQLTDAERIAWFAHIKSFWGRKLSEESLLVLVTTLEGMLFELDGGLQSVEPLEIGKE